MASYANVISAVEAAVAEAKQKLFEDVKAYIMGEIDDDSVEAIKDLFDKFVEDNAKTFEKPKKSKKRGSDEDKPVKAKRAPSEYNKFVGQKMKDIRAADPSLSAKEAMKLAMQEWNAYKATRDATPKPESKSHSEIEPVESETDNNMSEVESEPEPEPKKTTKKSTKKAAK